MICFTRLLALVSLLSLSVLSTEARSQKARSVSLSSAASNSKSFNISLTPLSYARESNIRVEYNPGWDFSFALEGIVVGQGEDLYDDEIQESNGDSLISKGGEIALYMATYTNQEEMGGFYWAFGLGYRNMNMSYKRSPTEKYSFSMKNQNQAFYLDENSKVNSKMQASGMTGHIRGGYRYVANNYPFSAGIYLGARHFQSEFKDRLSNSEDENSENKISPTSNEEKNSLERRYMSKFEPGIEIGVAF